jgi:hypothetical protein
MYLFIIGLGGCLGFGVGAITWKRIPMFKKDGKRK